MTDTNLDEETLECHVEFVNNIFSTKEIQNTDDSAKLQTVGSPSKPMIADLPCKQGKDVLCQKYWTELVGKDSF